MKDALLKNELMIHEEKKALRTLLSNRRAELTQERRAAAQKKLLALLHLLPKEGFVLSFSSFGSEIEMHEINQILAKERRLVLPKMEKEELKLFLVHDLSTDLTLHPYGLKEPNCSRCTSLALEELSLALIPALGFDSHHFRLGYGKGYYDRLLKGAFHLSSYGIGFEEQLVDQIPRDENDVKLSSLFLF